MTLKLMEVTSRKKVHDILLQTDFLSEYDDDDYYYYYVLLLHLKKLSWSYSSQNVLLC